VKRNKQVKFGTFKCQCGCGQTFTAEYVTRTPRYVDKKHRNKILAKRKAEQREVKQKELWRLYRERRAQLRRVGVKSSKALDLGVIGTEREFSALLRHFERQVKNDD